MPDGGNFRMSSQNVSPEEALKKIFSDNNKLMGNRTEYTNKGERKFELSEIFFSLEGEAQFTYHPTLYVRFARCNLKCPLFNNHNKLVGADGYATLDFEPEKFETIQAMPVITRGCDSQYSINPRFKQYWYQRTAEQICDDLIALTPDHAFHYKKTGLPIILSLTGGEPTLQWKHLPELIFQPKLAELNHILIETNCTVPFKIEFIDQISRWLEMSPDHVWTWSNSPKLHNSGYGRATAIKPAVANMQQELYNRFPRQVNQYMKFVSGDSDETFKEIDEVMEIYHQNGLRQIPIWVMPEACTKEQQELVCRNVAGRCKKEGYLYTHRLQNVLWDNAVGT